MNKGTGIPLSTTASIAVSALVLGKSVLLADMLPLINRYPQKPLIYNIVWKTLIYMVVATIIHYLERLWDFAKEAGGVVAGNDALLAKIVWPHFVAIEILLFVLVVIVLHDVRVHARDWQGQGAEDLLRSGLTSATPVRHLKTPGTPRSAGCSRSPGRDSAYLRLQQSVHQ